MMKKRLIFSLYTFFFLFFVKSQIVPNSIVQEMQAIDYNNMNTGILSLKVQLFNINFGSNITWNSSLEYSSNGIYVNEEESNIGVNWAYSFLGKVSRLNNDYNVAESYYDDTEDDILNKNLLLPANISKKQFFENPSAYNSKSNKFLNFIPDKFYFDFFGYKGYFIIDNKGIPIVHCDKSNLKVNLGVSTSGFLNKYDQAINFSQFTIVDEYGNKFYFGGNYDTLDINYDEYTSNPWVDFNPSYPEQLQVANYVIGSNTIAKRKNYISGWYLSKIEFANGMSVETKYLNGNQTVFSSFLANKKDYKNSLFPSNILLQSSNICGGAIHMIYNNISDNALSGSVNWDIFQHYNFFRKRAILQEVVFKNGDKEISNIKYSYDKDVNKRYYLNNIVVKSGNKLINDIKFTYDFLGTKKEWLFLKSIKNNDLNHDFEYYNSNLIPDKKYYIYRLYRGSRLDGELYHDMMDLETGLLKKYHLPTKGYKEFFYEKHDASKSYSLEGNSYLLKDGIFNNIKNSGMRIFKISENENDKNISKSIIYSYKTNDNNSSGIFDNVSDENHFSNYNDGLWNRYNYDNRKILYSKVDVKETGNGKIEYYFSDIQTHPDTLTMKSYFGTRPILKPASRNNERGYVLKKIIYNENNIKQQEIEYKYYNFIFPNLKEVTQNCLDCKISDANFYIVAENKQLFGLVDYRPVLPFPLKKEVIRNYYNNGIDFIEIIKEFEYNTNLINWHYRPINIRVIKGSDILLTKISYPQDLLLNSSYNVPTYNYVNQMITKGVTAFPITTTYFKNGNFIKLEQTVYGIDNNYSMVNPTEQLTYFEEKYINNLPKNLPEISQGFKEIIYDKYDSKSNLLQFTDKTGLQRTIIYGYNQTQPIAKIEGATYAQIMQAFSLSTTEASSYLGLDIVKKSDLDIDDTSEQDLLSALDTFRNNTAFKDFKITTYTYDPLIGVTSVTSPNGMKEFYKYNAQNKLEKVLDADGNILKEYKYQYKQ